MTFANPTAWLGLIPLWGMLVLLYMLRIRRKQALVTGAFLWPERTESVRADSPFQRLQVTLLFLIQMLLAFGLIWMLARPQWNRPALVTESTVFIVDTSASMNAQEGSQTRFEMAKDLLQGAIASKPSGARVAILECGATTRIVAGLTQDEATLQRAVRTLEPSDSESGAEEAVRLAAAMAKNQPGAKVVLLSDGVFEDLGDIALGDTAFAFEPIGQHRDNAYFEAFATGTVGESRQLLVSIQGSYAEKQRFPVTVRGDDEVIARLDVVLEPGKPYRRTVNLNEDYTKLEAKIEFEDALDGDNIALCSGPNRRSLRVLLLSPGNVFLERAFNLDSRVILERTTKLPDSEKPGQKPTYDLVVFDGMPEQPCSAPHVLVLGKPLEVGGVKLDGVLLQSQATVTLPGQITEAVDFTEAYVSSGFRVKTSAGARIWIDSPNGPWLVESTNGTTRRLIVPFSILESDLPLQPAFPILISNITTWASAPGAANQTTVQTAAPGSTISLSGWDRGTLFGPNGDQRELSSQGGGVRASLRRVGWHTVRNGERTAYLGIQLLNSKESILTPGRLLGYGSSTGSGGNRTSRFADVWPWFALGALALLCLEWWVYVRKS